MPRRTPPSLPFAWDKFSLYELCAQNPPRDARLLHAIYRDSLPVRWSAAPNLTLGEDFCGTAALSRAWCALHLAHRAVAIDIDKPTLARAAELARAAPDLKPRLKLIRSDVMGARDKADLIAVLNFSVCELHTRKALLAYLRHARSRLKPRGILVCDLYGGADAFETGMIDQKITPPAAPHPGARDRITYSWEQRTADPLTARVVNAMHFEVRVGRLSEPARGRSGPRTARPQVFLNAFVYDWRLWSIPELRDAMREAGFGSTSVYPRTAGATDPEGNLYTHPVEDPADLGDSFNVFIAAAERGMGLPAHVAALRRGR